MLQFITRSSFSPLFKTKRRLFVLYTLVLIVATKVALYILHPDSIENMHDVTTSQLNAILANIEESLALHPELVKTSSRLGVIDHKRTPFLLSKMQQKLTRNVWLFGDCDLRPISNGVFSNGYTATIHEYLSEIQTERTVISIAYRDYASKSEASGDISLLLQMSADRLDLLTLIAERWPGPINAAIYTPIEQFLSYFHQVSTWLRLVQRKNIMVHLVQRTGRLYPVNWLRNFIMKNASTEYILVSDADFLPSASLKAHLLTAFRKIEASSTRNNKALIIPAFELFDDDPSRIPETKQNLLKLIDEGAADVFHRQSHPNSHRIWQFDRWKQTTHSYALPYEKTCSEPEPYIAVKKSQSPYFPETLLERGKNKVAYHFEMCMDDFQFTVIADGYLIHLAHPVSAKANMAVERCMMDGWREYRQYLAQVTNKQHLYFYPMPDFVRNILYFFQSLCIEFLWLLLFELPLITVLVLNKIWMLRRLSTVRHSMSAV